MWRQRSRYRDGVSVYALYRNDVFDNMAFGLKLRKTPRMRSRESGEAAKVLNNEMLLNRNPNNSGGQRQRVAVGRASCVNRKFSL